MEDVLVNNMAITYFNKSSFHIPIFGEKRRTQCAEAQKRNAEETQEHKQRKKSCGMSDTSSYIVLVLPLNLPMINL